MHSAAEGGHRSTETTMNSNLAASDVREQEEGRGQRRRHRHHHCCHPHQQHCLIFSSFIIINNFLFEKNCVRKSFYGIDESGNKYLLEEPEILRYWEISRLTYNILGDIFCLLMLSKAKSILFDEKCVLKRGKVRKEVLVCQASGG